MEGKSWTEFFYKDGFKPDPALDKLSPTKVKEWGTFKVAEYEAWTKEETIEHNARFDYYCKMAYRYHNNKDYDSTRVDELYKPPRRHFVSTLQTTCNLKSKKDSNPVIKGDVFVDILLDTEAQDKTLTKLIKEFNPVAESKEAVEGEKPEEKKMKDQGGCFINRDNYGYSVKRCRRSGHELQKLQLYKIIRGN